MSHRTPTRRRPVPVSAVATYNRLKGLSTGLACREPTLIPTQTLSPFLLASITGLSREQQPLGAGFMSVSTCVIKTQLQTFGSAPVVGRRGLRQAALFWAVQTSAGSDPWRESSPFDSSGPGPRGSPWPPQAGLPGRGPAVSTLLEGHALPMGTGRADLQNQSRFSV